MPFKRSKSKERERKKKARQSLTDEQKTISKESLQSPFNSPVRGSDPKQTYETLAENIKKFQSTGDNYLLQIFR